MAWASNAQSSAKNMKRALRRYKNKIRQLKSDRIRKYWSWETKNPRYRGISRDTFTVCSCPMCCNRRKIEGKSLSELKSIDSNPIK